MHSRPAHSMNSKFSLSMQNYFAEIQVHCLYLVVAKSHLLANASQALASGELLQH
jgi:hypothetical protein